MVRPSNAGILAMNEQTNSTRTRAADIRTFVDASEARRLLGVGAFTVHNKWPTFIEQFISQIKKVEFFNFSELSPEKKRERILLIVLLVGALAYGASYLVGAKKEAGGSSFTELLQNPDFAAVLKTVQDEQKRTDVGPDILQESYRRYHRDNL